MTPPPPPDGFVLEQNTPPPPPGFVLEGAQQSHAAAEPPSPMVRLGRGFMDVGQGLKQLYLMATDPQEAEKYRAQVNDELQRYDAGRQVQQSQESPHDLMNAFSPGIGTVMDAFTGAGPDLMRGAGNVLATGPAAAVAPAAGGALGRVASAAGTGAVLGGAEYSPEGTVADKIKQAALGAVGGGAAQGLVEGVAPMVARAAQAAGGKSVDPAIQARIDEFNKAGVPYTEAQVTRDPRAWTAEERARKLEGVGDPLQQVKQAQNDALLQQLPGMRPQGAGTPYEAAENVRGAVGDYAKSTQQQVSAKYDAAENGPGADQLVNKDAFFSRIDPILDRFEDAIPGSVRARIEQLRSGSPKPARSSGPAPLNPNVDDFTTAVKKLGGIKPSDERIGSVAEGLPIPGVWNKNGRTLDDMATPPNSDPLASAIDNLTKQLAVKNNPQPAGRDFTTSEAAKLYKLVNDRMGGELGATGKAGKELKRALMDAGADTGGDVAGATNAFADATQAARQRFAELSPQPIASLAKVSEAPVNYVETKILGGKPQEIAGLRDVLQKQSPQAWQDVRGQVMDWLAQKATMNDPAGQFSGKRFGDALDRIGNDRLKVLFSTDELSKLGTIRRTAYNATVAPPLSAVNHSNTASELANLMQPPQSSSVIGRALQVGGNAIGHVPLVGPLLRGAYDTGVSSMRSKALEQAVRGAINPAASHFATPNVNAKDVRRALARALLGPAAVAGGITSGP